MVCFAGNTGPEVSCEGQIQGEETETRKRERRECRGAASCAPVVLQGVAASADHLGLEQVGRRLRGRGGGAWRRVRSEARCSVLWFLSLQLGPVDVEGLRTA